MESLELFLSGLVVQYLGHIPLWGIAVLVFIGSLHLVIPPVQAAVEAIVKATPSTKDDEIYQEVVESKYYKIFVKVVKWVSGLDLSKAKKK